MRCPVWLLVFVSGVSVAMGASAPARDGTERSVRLATFNIKEIHAEKLNRLDEAGRGADVQLRKAAEIIQRISPDILLVNEIDFDKSRQNAALFRDRYLKVSQAGQHPLDYPHIFVAPVNTGVPTGMDLDKDGTTNSPNDAFGFGHYPGEYGMALFSRFPIDANAARTFQSFLWKDMPGHIMPDGQGARPGYYTPEQARVFRLSSKSHWDVSVQVFGRPVHILASHPTPPIFDGPEDSNGRRNHDEIRFWADYITSTAETGYMADDGGKRGGLGAKDLFVIMGDLNSDPIKMEEHAAYQRPTITQIIQHPRVQDPRPRSLGSAVNAEDYPGDKTTRTNSFGRIDYVLPCRELLVRDAGVFWPPPGDVTYPLVSEPDPASDHYLVWVDVTLP